MIKSITLNSFKSFEELNNLEIKPITVLCGANSSGKSSIFKSILTVKQSFESKSAKNSLLLNGKYVNNGKFSNLVHKNTGDNFKIKNSFEIKRGKDKYSQDSYSYRTLEKIYKKIGEIHGHFTIEYEICISQNINFSSKRNRTDNVLEYCSIKISPKLIYNNEPLITCIELTKHKNQEFEYTIKWINIPNQLGDIKSDSIACTCYFSGFQLINIYALYDSYSSIYDVLPNILSFFELVAQQYKNISYIGPLREAPARRYIYEEEIDEIGIKGENAPYILSNENYLIKGSKNILNDNPLSLVEKDINFREQVYFWLQYLGIDNFSFLENGDVLSLLVQGDNIADVGFGVSQALPIIVEGVNINKDQSLVLEQPEIHLHPKMQMKLADFFITMAVSGKQVIIETHSDHIVNRLIRRVMEDKTHNLTNLVKIYFVEQKNRVSTVSEINIDKIKGVTTWPKDFFDQYSAETERMIEIGFMNFKEKNSNK